MNNKILYFSIIILVLSNLSFKWPVQNGRITSTYGESRGDHFHDGVDMICRDDKVYPVDSGKLLFFWDKSIFPLENYPGGGNYKIIKHDKNMHSVYLHLKDGVSLQNIYSVNNKIGMVGNSGRSFAKHLHFSIINLKNLKSINPFLLMPRYKDEKGPDIKNIFLKINKKYFLIRDNAKIRLTKHYPILVRIVDTFTKSERLGVYRLKAVLNGKEVLDISFKSLVNSKKGLKISNNLFHNLYDEEGYYKVEDVRYFTGLNKLKIIAFDYSGNKSEKLFNFDVNLDIKKDN
ncbi:M23 family metallopeptidase [Spirochaetota bacterium]